MQQNNLNTINVMNATNNYGPSSANSGGSNRNSTKRNSNIVMTRGMINHNGFLNDPNANPN
jgi:hypothetical protein